MYKEGLIYLIDNDGELQCTLSDDIDPMEHHWMSENHQFMEELEQWESFREFQGRWKHKARPETQLELENTDARLIEVLTRMNDWKEFEVFEGLNRVDALHFEDECLEDFRHIIKWEVTAEPLQTNPEVHDAIRDWLCQLDESQEELEATSNQLDWIKGQWPKVVAESTGSISRTPGLQNSLEAKFRKQTHAIFSTIQKLGGRPSHAVSPPDHFMDIFHKILYWSSESSKYKEEWLDWKTFLDWRRYIRGESPKTKPRSYQCPQFQSDLEFFAEFEKFRLFQYDLALTWLKCWQRVVRWHEEEIETPSYLDGVEVARSHVRDSERKVTYAATRLEKSKQEHTRAISEHGQQIGGKTETECTEKLCPPTAPLSSSKSPQSSRSSSSIAPYSPSPPSPPSSQASQTSQSPPSPFSSQTSQSPPSPLSSQTSQSTERLSKDRRSAEKRRRRSKKEDTRKKVAKMGNTNTEQKTVPPFSSSPRQAAKDDDIQMTDALEDPRPMGPIKEYEKADSEDTVMTDFEDPPNHNLSNPADIHSTPTTSIASKRLPSSSIQGPTSRKTRSTTKLEQALDGKILKNTGKKPSKKVKVFTEQQKLLLLNVVSNDSSSMGSPPPRRSERLKQKAAASATESQSLDAARPSQSSGDKQPQKKTGSVGPPRPSRKKNPKEKLDTLEPPLTPRQKKLEMQSKTM